MLVSREVWSALVMKGRSVPCCPLTHLAAHNLVGSVQLFLTISPGATDRCFVADYFTVFCRCHPIFVMSSSRWFQCFKPLFLCPCPQNPPPSILFYQLSISINFYCATDWQHFWMQSVSFPGAASILSFSDEEKCSPITFIDVRSVEGVD